MYKIEIARRKALIRRRRQILCILLVGIFAVSLFLIRHNSNVEVEKLQRQIEYVKTRTILFDDTYEWEAEEVPYYNIELTEDLQLYTFTRCADLGIPQYYELVLAMMWQESNYNPTIISKTNDYGLMQINKINHSRLEKQLGITDFLDPYQSITAGTEIIASLLVKYDDPHKALMAYNFGEAGARRHWTQGTYTSAYSRAIAAKQTKICNELKKQ